MPEYTKPDPTRGMENVSKMVKDFQAEQWKSVAIVSAPGVAMAASRARQQSEARANEMLAQQQQMNHQMWIQNQLLSGRSMQDIQAQIDTEQAVASRQQQAVDPFHWGSALFLLLFAIGVIVALVYGFSHPNDGGTGGAEFTSVVHGLGAVSQFLNYS